MRRVVALGAAIAAAPALPAAAEAPLAPSSFTIGGSLETEFDLDRIARRGDRKAYWDFYNKTELALYLNLPAGFTVNGVFKIEPADRDHDGTDRFLRAEAAWVDQLYLNWGYGPVEVFAGKIHPRFGFAWDIAPGLYGTDFAEGYELVEKIGGGVRLSLSDLAGVTGRYGQHSLQVEVFQADRTGLSSSLFARRYAVSSTSVDPDTGEETTHTRFAARNRLRYGGADNTKGFGNYVVSLAGNGTPLPLGMLDYTLGFSSRRAGADSVDAGTEATERGYVGGFAWEVGLPFRITATPMVEWLHLDNADGVSGTRRDVVTAGFALSRRPFTFAYAYEWQRDKGDVRYRANQHTASVSYDLSQATALLKGFEWTIGWRRLSEDGVATDDFGTQLTYGYRF